MGALKKCPIPPTVEKKKPLIDSVDNSIQKAEIERFKKLLGEKIKDPEIAKKAALIIGEMLNPKE